MEPRTLGWVVKSRSRLDEEDAARFESEGGRLFGEPEIRHFCDESWCDLPRHESHGHDLPAHWSEFVVDAGGVTPIEAERSVDDPSWSARMVEAPAHA